MTPEQIERRRASRERWRARNPNEWKVRRVRQTSGSPGPGRPDTPPDTSDVEALRVRVAELLAIQSQLEAELAELRAYRQKNIDRSRRNHHRKGDRPPRPAATGRDRPPTGTLPPRARQPVVPPSGDTEREVFDNTTTSARSGDLVVVVAPDPASVDVWTEPSLQAAIADRGIDVQLLKCRVGDWLRRNPQAQLTVSTIAGFIERWRPGLDERAPRPAGRRAGPRTRETHDGKWDAYMAAQPSRLKAFLANTSSAGAS